MRNVRIHGLNTVLDVISPRPLNTRAKTSGTKHSRTAPTTNKVVLSALCSLANL